jgi:hypothetical protein
VLQDRVQWWALENIILKIQVPQKTANLSGWVTTSLRRTLLCGVTNMLTHEHAYVRMHTHTYSGNLAVQTYSQDHKKKALPKIIILFP